MTQAINATIYYHTEVFTPKTIAVMGSLAFAGITLIVVGILGLVHVIDLPLGGSYALMGLGGGALITDAILLVTYTNQHQIAKKPMNDYLEKVDERKKNERVQPGAEDVNFYIKTSGEGAYGVFQRINQVSSIHLFLTKEARDAHANALPNAFDRSHRTSSTTR